MPALVFQQSLCGLAESLSLLMGQVIREVALPCYRQKEKKSDFIQVFSFWTCIDEVKDPKTVLLNKWEDFDTGSISFQ